MAGKIANAGSARVAEADQVKLKDWYNDSRGWSHVYRHSNKQLAELASDIAIKACNNDNVQYSYGSTQYWSTLQQVGYDPTKITSRTTCDCFSFVCANYHAAGKLLGVSEIDKMPLIGTDSAPQLTNCGFSVFTDTNHTRTDANAEKGDIYICSGHGTMYVGDGVDSSGILPGGSGGTGGKFSLEYLGISEDDINPYIYAVPYNQRYVNTEKIKSNRGFAALLYGGKLFTDTHTYEPNYIAPYLETQAKSCIEGGLPWALWVDVCARNYTEADKELSKLYYVANAYPPALGLWLNPKFLTKDKAKNQLILKYYHETLEKWGLGNACGLYIDEEQLEKIDWDSLCNEYYLWFRNPTPKMELFDDVYLVADIFSTDVELSNNPRFTPELTSVITTAEGSVNTNYGTVHTGSMTGKGQTICDKAATQSSPGSGYCAKWVSQVYQSAGLGYPGGDARDQYKMISGCIENNTPIEPGMAIAVSTHPGTNMGRIYGHVGIYIGNNQVRHNVGSISNMGLAEWINKYGKTVSVHWGYLA